jgi:predicted permease
MLTLEGKQWQVIGVMPASFQFQREADVWVPMAMNEGEHLKRERGAVVSVVGQLKPGVTVERAQSDLNLIARRIEQADPKQTPGAQVNVLPLDEKIVGNLRRALWALLGAVAFVLLIACANAANLLLARSSGRASEMAIRAAMGAGRGRLVRQMLTESLLLSVCGGVAGLFLALMGVRALAPLIPDNLAHLRESGIDGAALGFTFLASLLTGVVVGIIPALQASRIDLNESLKEGARSAAFSKRKGARRVSPALVVGELALTLAVLTGAGLLIKSYIRVQAVDPGFNPENLLTMRIPHGAAGYPIAQRNIINQDLLTSINSLPGVEVAAMGPIPLTETRTTTDGPSEFIIDVKLVSNDYFRAMGMQLRKGRGFTELDNENSPPVVVINEAVARSSYPGEDPIGKIVD